MGLLLREGGERTGEKSKGGEEGRVKKGKGTQFNDSIY